MIFLAIALAASAENCPSFMYDPTTGTTTCLKDTSGPHSKPGTPGWRQFQRFQDEAEPLISKAANAMAIEMCNLQPDGWYQRVSRMHGEAENNLLNRLAPQDRNAGDAYLSRKVKERARWTLGGNGPNPKACHDLAQMHFVYNWASFVP